MFSIDTGTRLLEEPMYEAMPKIVIVVTAMLFFHIENIVINVQNMPQLTTYVTLLTQISNYQTCHVFLIGAMNVLVFLSLKI